MAIETETKPEELLVAPTTLHLFMAKGGELEKLTAQFDEAADFRVKQRRAIAAIQKSTEISNSRKLRLAEANIRHQQQIQDVKSSMSCGLVYLKLLEELTPMGVEDAQIWDFFKLSLKTDQEAQFEHVKNGRHIVQGLDSSSIGRNHDVQTITETTMKNVGDPPCWFAGNKPSWVEFFFDHAFFQLYLDQDKSYQKIKGMEQYEDITIPFGYVSVNALPDWITEKDSPPTKREVEQELEDDSAELNLIVEAFRVTVKQMWTTITTSIEKAVNLYQRTAKEEIRIFPKVSNLAELLMVIETIQNDGTKTLVSDVVRMLNLEVNSDKNSGSNSEQFIKEYSEKIGLSQTELIALWLEKTFRQSKMVNGVAESISQSQQNALVEILNQPEILPTGLPDSLDYLRASEKQTFNGLFYELRPLLAQFSQTDRRYLLESLEIYREQAIENWIWDFSEIL